MKIRIRVRTGWWPKAEWQGHAGRWQDWEQHSGMGERGTQPQPWDAAAPPAPALPSAPAATRLLVKELEAENWRVKRRRTSPTPSKSHRISQNDGGDHLLGRARGARGSRLDWIPTNGGFGKQSSILGKSSTFPSAQQTVPVSAEPTRAKMFITKGN